MILTGWKMCGFKAQNYVKKKSKIIEHLCHQKLYNYFFCVHV